jgi:hypothetical protein
MTPEQRALGKKQFFGILGTHLAAGGILGAAIQPIKWAFGFAMLAFGDDDDPDWTLKNALSGDAFDRAVRNGLDAVMGPKLGMVAAKGLPTVAGADLSSRMTLGQLYFVDLKTDTVESTLGSVAMSFGGPALSILGNAIRGSQYIMEGETQKGVELMVPKMARDMLRTFRYSNDGLTDATGKVILAAKDLSPGDLFLQAMGAAPVQTTEMYDRNSAVKDAQRFANTKREKIIKLYRDGDQSDKRKAIRELIEFRKLYPELTLTVSDLEKSRRSKYKREQSVQQYGAVLGARERRFAEAGSAYNVE